MSRIFLLITFCLSLSKIGTGDDIDYVRDVAPILAKYCAGCHNDVDKEGELSLASFASLTSGGENGPVLVPGRVSESRIVQMVTGASKPKMPPEDEPQPSAAEIDVLKRWIAGGAPGPRVDQPQSDDPVTPKLPPAKVPHPVTSLAVSPDGRMVAVARFRAIELRRLPDLEPIGELTGHAGKVNSVAFDQNGRLLAASGVAGVRGEIVVWDPDARKPLARLTGHRDIIYAAIPSNDGQWIASGGYDRDIILWDRDSGKPVRNLKGHNGAVFDLAFTPNGRVLASASADATVKIWDVQSGARLDTLSQPLKEQYAVCISPDSRFVFACGADNRIRKWRLLSLDRPQINPLLISRFGHEHTVEKIALRPDGRMAVTAADDFVIKVWDVEHLTERQAIANQPDSVQALAFLPNGQQIVVGRMDGSLQVIDLKADSSVPLPPSAPLAKTEVPRSFQDKLSAGDEPKDDESEENDYEEHEPNDYPLIAQEISLPAKIQGVVSGDQSGVDLFRFQASKGDTWIVELIADGDDSPLDPHVAILNQDGNPVVRTLLQAVRDSYFTFRGKDSNQTGDFRLHNWQEMQLNQFLYASGEVVKLYHYPRGPDSGFNVYPNFGARHGYFDTTPIAHALGEPCYVVEPRSPEATIVPNGLPVFPIYFENDDASDRSMGKNSRLTFVAPRDGNYLIEVSDIRGFEGERFRYRLVVRRPKPDFEVVVATKNPKVPLGQGRKIDFRLKRRDGFSGAVRIEIENLPAGFSVPGPTLFEPDHLRAWSCIVASENAKQPTADQSQAVRITATAVINGQQVVRSLGSLGKIELGDVPKVGVRLSSTGRDPDVLEVVPGTTVTAKVTIERKGHDGRVAFGSEEALINTPHGVYVDNIGLNGVLIPEGNEERTIFITTEPWVKPTERWVFVQASVGQNPTSNPILLRVVPRSESDVVRAN